MNSREKRCFLKSCLRPLLIVWLSWCVGWRLFAILDLEAYSWSMRLENSYKFMRRMRKKNYIYWKHAAAAKLLQSCPTLCNPIDSSPPGSPVPGILQARTLEWVAISFSNAWNWKMKVKSLSHVWLFATPKTAAQQAPPSLGFSRQEHWSGLHAMYHKWF